MYLTEILQVKLLVDKILVVTIRVEIFELYKFSWILWYASYP